MEQKLLRIALLQVTLTGIGLLLFLGCWLALSFRGYEAAGGADRQELRKEADQKVVGFRNGKLQLDGVTEEKTMAAVTNKKLLTGAVAAPVRAALPKKTHTDGENLQRKHCKGLVTAALAITLQACPLKRLRHT